MARVIVKTHVNKEDNFVSLVNEFKEVKKTYDAIEKRYNTLKDMIKKHMISNEISDIDTDGFTVRLQKVEKQSFDTEKLINFGKQHSFDFIKYIEAIDEEKLETLIYNGFIAPSQLEPFQKVSVQYRLTAK